eukprot:2481510-Rhodomonas_salina.2
MERRLVGEVREVGHIRQPFAHHLLEMPPLLARCAGSVPGIARLARTPRVYRRDVHEVFAPKRFFWQHHPQS